MNDEKVRGVTEKLMKALSPYPKETQIQALLAVARSDALDTAVEVELGTGDHPPRSNLEAIKGDIERAMSPLSPASRDRVVRTLRKQYQAEILRLQSAQIEKLAVRDEVQRQMAVVEELRAWSQGMRLCLERNDCSRLHMLKAASAQDRLISGEPDHYVANEEERASPQTLRQTFVVKHDWADAFANAEGISDDFRLPYDSCAFEFRISGRTVILGAAQVGDVMGATGYLEAGDYWYITPRDIANEGLLKFLWSQARAICIALDAEVATDTVIRAPHKLNEKRAKAGKVPLHDYRVVDLARRHRVANPASGIATGARKRLHFRRGHWRHYETSKTWVKWCLVGDPDLGFIQKHYSL